MLINSVSKFNTVFVFDISGQHVKITFYFCLGAMCKAQGVNVCPCNIQKPTTVAIFLLAAFVSLLFKNYFIRMYKSDKVIRQKDKK